MIGIIPTTKSKPNMFAKMVRLIRLLSESEIVPLATTDIRSHRGNKRAGALPDTPHLAMLQADQEALTAAD
ncbi:MULTISPECIES: hypothetical protein [Rhizobium]|uniref:hypothetical protein n=1 Tax=Rhizobium TaxID=379 RepID=UPI0015CF04B8|nr:MULTISPECIES: hypothetical protein [Rhizobium]MBB4215315.1 hypothetical protein [Rhizobium sp. BK212]MBB4250629.1 hypothetical protein [Rhizobium sp. BK008]